MLKLLEKINNFWNQMPYSSDFHTTGEKDYWFTPLEFVEKGAGDCEDFAIAKYFTLRGLGVQTEKLMLTYCLLLNVPHMVLTYEDHGEILVLDNIPVRIMFLKDRNELRPIYSFNHLRYVIESTTGRKDIGKSPMCLSKWRGVIQRMITDDQTI